jgi:hypothetical protein
LGKEGEYRTESGKKNQDGNNLISQKSKAGNIAPYQPKKAQLIRPGDEPPAEISPKIKEQDRPQSQSGNLKNVMSGIVFYQRSYNSDQKKSRPGKKINLGVSQINIRKKYHQKRGYRAIYSSQKRAGQKGKRSNCFKVWNSDFFIQEDPERSPQ